MGRLDFEVMIRQSVNRGNFEFFLDDVKKKKFWKSYLISLLGFYFSLSNFRSRNVLLGLYNRIDNQARVQDFQKGVFKCEAFS